MSKRKITAIGVGAALLAGAFIGLTPMAASAGQATVCNSTTQGIQVYPWGGSLTIIPSGSCRNNVHQIAPPRGKCYRVMGSYSGTINGWAYLVTATGGRYTVYNQYYC